MLVFDRLVVAPARPARPFFRRRPRGFLSPARILGNLFRFFNGEISRFVTFAARSSHGSLSLGRFRVAFSLAWSFARFFSGARLPPASLFDCAPAESTSSRTQRLRVPTTAFASRVRPWLLSLSSGVSEASDEGYLFGVDATRRVAGKPLSARRSDGTETRRLPCLGPRGGEGSCEVGGVDRDGSCSSLSSFQAFASKAGLSTRLLGGKGEADHPPASC